MENTEYPGQPGDKVEQPYKDDTSDGSTAPHATPDEIAEQTVDQVKSSDDVLREEAGVDHPVEGHDVRDYKPVDTSGADDSRNPGHPDFEPQHPEQVGDDAGVDEHGDDTPDVDEQPSEG